MDYIPPTSLSAMVDFIVASACAVVIYFRRKSIGKENILTANFLRVFIVLSFGFFLFTLPSTVIFDPTIVQLLSTFGNASFIIAMSFLIFVPARIFSLEDRKTKVLSWRLITSALSYRAINLILFKPADVIYFKPFVDWREGTIPIMQVVLWFLVASSLLWMAILFVVRGWFHQDSLTRRRSRIYAVGFTLIFIGWLVILLFQISASKNPLILFGGGSLGCAFISLGMIMLLVATISKDSPVLKNQQPAG